MSFLAHTASKFQYSSHSVLRARCLQTDGDRSPLHHRLLSDGHEACDQAVGVGSTATDNDEAPAADGTANDLLTLTDPSRPRVVYLSHVSGPASGGTAVTILGNYFANVTEVLFGQVPATGVKVVSSNRITAVAPSHDAGLVEVQIGTQAGTTAAGRFTYLATPEVTEIKPNHGPTRGGTLVIIHGGNFVTGETKVYFGKRLAKDVKVLSSRLLVVKTPADEAGTVMLAVATPEGVSAEVPFEFAQSSSCVQSR